ncbi:hypothetical protein WICPIJ_002744 [Wickerhamomyces pijperi]|uniref:Uncharacterized protein n=1 Tax=Wickerhamomyces pijperi TaxID=599730 RepID=A0A9P8QAY1_WICPI|nr:hypothetical protein WICPIJ_002744 [Wickerhamomyces pijperi]
MVPSLEEAEPGDFLEEALAKEGLTPDIVSRFLEDIGQMERVSLQQSGRNTNIQRLFDSGDVVLIERS